MPAVSTGATVPTPICRFASTGRLHSAQYIVAMPLPLSDDYWGLWSRYITTCATLSTLRERPNT
jgi:hypothetical protein